jgi:pilus assembly protein Flp/PilA
MMNMIVNKLLDFFREEEGLTTVEYAIGGALVGLGVVAAFTALGDGVETTINDLTAAVLTR